jgi:hypothetical protein
VVSIVKNKKHMKNMEHKNELENEYMHDILNTDLTYHEQSKNLNLSCNKEYKCKCSKVFKHKQSLFNHKKKCELIKTNLDDNFKNEMLNEIKELKETIGKLTNISNPININVTNKNVTNKIANVYNHIVKNYTKAEPIKLLGKNDITKLLTYKATTDNHSIEDIIIFNYSKQLFDQFVGNIIVNEYKKKNPLDQQIWSSDVTRLSFIVRRILKDMTNQKVDEKIWMQDKKGVCLTQLVIEPIIEEIRVIIFDYCDLCKSQMKVANLKEIEKLSENVFYILKIMYEINTKEIHSKILKYIAPHFQLEI